MVEDTEQQQMAENEAKRQIRDLELAKILAMGEAERKSLMKRCREIEDNLQKGASRGDIPLLAFDSREPENLAIGFGKGQHSEAIKKVLWKIDPQDCEVMEKSADEIMGRRIWRGIIHILPDFQSKIIKLYIQNNCSDFDDYLLESEKQEGKEKAKEYYLKRLNGIWQIFKEKYPDWIMVDIDGNPLEEVLSQEESK